MKNIYITESQIKKIIEHFINETVYMSDKNDRNKTVNLKYNKGQNYSRGNVKSNDMLNTDLMDQSNDKTIEIKLKGGITSYNITSIKGEDVMHYFKNKFDACNAVETEIAGEKYKILMDDANFRQFLSQFTTKVNNVIDSYIKNLNINTNEIKGISIYPVKSSKNFNKNMAKIISDLNLCNLPSQVIDDNLLSKDLRNLEIDNEFVDKNKNFYNGRFYKSGGDDSTVMSHLTTALNKQNAIRKILIPYINALNDSAEKILKSYYYLNNASKRMVAETAPNYSKDTSKSVKTLVDEYRMYIDLYRECSKYAIYEDDIKNKTSKFQLNKNMVSLKRSKPASITKRTDEIWSIVAPYLRGIKSPIDNKPYTKLELKRWEIEKFEIKTMPNSVRMGLKNIYNPNEDEELVQRELERIKGTIFVIFDDNISGGATLGDICYQCKQMGIQYILPITFGKMAEKTTTGILPHTMPTNNNGDVGYNY